jgi:hypothetical protein
MISRLVKIAVFALLLTGAGAEAYSQPDLPDASTSGRSGRSADTPMGVKEMLAKQRAERDKKDHQEMLDRGEEALRIANQLEASFNQSKEFSKQDQARLQSLEKVITKIRKELGGDDDVEVGDANYMRSDDEPKPSNMEEAFKFLRSTTVRLVDELKKTTRFSISVIAIQSSNSVLKLVKFLRLRK